MNAKRLPMIVGLVLALGTGLLMLNYLSQLRATAATAPKMRPVVVATREIPARSPISATMLAIAERPVDQVDSDAVDAPRQALNQMAIITIPAGGVITKSKIAATPALALPTRLKNGLRAVSISIDRVKGVSGLIEPGDRVDVIAVPPRVGNETPKATTILRGALVLAMGNETEVAHATPSPENQNLTTVTLAVSPQQADLLALADVDTTLRLALRSPGEPIRSFPTEPLVLGTNEHGGGSGGFAPSAVPPGAPATAAPAPPAPQQAAEADTGRARHVAHGKTYTIIDGDHVYEGSSTGGSER